MVTQLCFAYVNQIIFIEEYFQMTACLEIHLDP